MAGPTEPGERPAGRRLERPPGERYLRESPAPERPDPNAGGTDPGRPPARGATFAFLVALGGAVALTLLAGALNVTVGLLVVAALIGRFVGLALLAGGAPKDDRTFRALAAAIAVAGVAVGQAGIWLYARSEGGVLGPLDYLGQTFGVLVPLEFLVAGAVGWWSAGRRGGTGG